MTPSSPEPGTDPAELPRPRSWSKRLRHHRYDYYWRLRLRSPDPREQAEVTPDPACPDFAVAAIAISEKYADWCLSMIDSLRRAGRYSGPVYVVTDTPQWFAGQPNIVPIVVPTSKKRLIAKSCKALLFGWLSQRFVAYIDADMIVTAPIAPWYARARERLAAVDSPILTYRANNPVPGAYHGGLIFADRAAARPFMQTWLAMMRSGRYLSDQVALKRIATPSVPAYFADESFVYLYKLLDAGSTDAAHTPTFVHITDRMIQDHPTEALLAYMRDTLGLVRLPEHFGNG